jgi:hypothetical protein
MYEYNKAKARCKKVKAYNLILHQVPGVRNTEMIQGKSFSLRDKCVISL